MSSARFDNPGYQSDKEVQGNVPPPVRPRPIISLPADNGDGTDVYAEYIYIDHPKGRVDFSSSHKGPSENEASDNGEYIYIVDPVGNTGGVCDVGPFGRKSAGPLPTAPPPSAGEYIYFDQSVSPKTLPDSGEYIYMEEPTAMKYPGKPQATTPSPAFGSPRKPAPPIASVRPLPLKPSSKPSGGRDDIIKGGGNIYEELPEGQGHPGGMADRETSPMKSVGVLEGDADLDNDLYLQPACIAK